ncbi:MAG: HEAT repeat domain-containing protein [Planctomycetota bacterium]|nr:HEAT repeat domain-containing protein [Planctomycetota bacterium]
MQRVPAARIPVRLCLLALLASLLVLPLPPAAWADEDPAPESPGARLARLERDFASALARHDARAYAEQRRILSEIADLDSPAAQLALRDLLSTHGSTGDRIRTLNLLRAVARRGHPEDLDEVIRYVERAHDPLLVASLAEVLAATQRESAQKHLMGKALKRATPLVRAQILPALGMIGRKDTSLAIIPHLKSDHLEVRIEAIGALGLLGDASSLGLLAPFANPAAEADWRVRRAVVRAVGMIGQQVKPDTARRALAILLRTLEKEPHERVIEMHAQALGMLGLPGAVEALIAGLEKYVESNLRLADAFGSALHRISGKPLGIDVDLWKSWWTVMKDQPFERVEQEGGGGTAAGVRYYGFPVRSSKVVFVLDVSRSMGWNERLDTAKDELKRTISKLPRSTRFNILTYSDEVRAWRARLSDAKPSNLRTASMYIGRQRPDNGTNSYAALAAAFRDQDVDTIFFLTDGHPTTGELIDPDLILAAVRSWNRHRHVRLHTIALMRGEPPPAFAGKEDPRTASAFMKRLAEENDGRFREIR